MKTKRMGYEALITVGFDKSISDEQRERFVAFVEKLEWEQLPELGAAFACSFPEEVTREEAMTELEDDVSEAKEFAEIERCHVAVQLSKEEIDLFYA